MKKAVAMVLMVMMVVLSVSAFAAGHRLTVDEAKQAALKHTGVSVQDATFTKACLDWEDGRQVYEIEFVAGGMEYEMDVDVYTGRITDDSKEPYDWDDD